MSKLKILVLCTGNSCRSQMAEAILNHKYGNTLMAYSAGTKPAGYVHPKAIEVLKEIGITHTGNSKHTDEFRDMEFDLVLTVCDSAAEACPVWPGKGRTIHHSFPDPAITNNIHDFRSVRDSILKTLPELLRIEKE